VCLAFWSLWAGVRAQEAQKRLAVLEFQSPSGASTPSDLQGLSGAARSAATQAVRSDVSVMTVETILALRQESVACSSDFSCAVDVGRYLKAQLVMSGTVGRFAGNQLVLDLQLHDVGTGGLLAADQLRASDMVGLLDRVPLAAKGLLLQAGYSALAGKVETTAAPVFSFDVSALSASVDQTLAREREARCVVEAGRLAEAKQASALKASVAAATLEVDAAWRSLLPALESCRGLDDLTQRAACAAQAKAFADRAAVAEAKVAAGAYTVTTACGAKTLEVAGQRAALASPRVAEARGLAEELGKARVVDFRSPTLGMMRLIPAGTFTMGCKPGRDDVAGGCDSDEVPHTVTLTKPYYMMEHEVTQGEWSAVMGSNPSSFSSCGPTCPVEQVSWDDVQAFIAKVSARDGVTYRLPTEAEWEYAARGGAGFAYAGSSDLGSVGWFSDNAGSKTHPVCGKARNGYGLCDMTGNVWEWTADWDGGYASSAQTDPRGPASGSLRVSRGGGWFLDAQYARVADRYGRNPVNRYDLLGFRLVRSVP
jgi:formylglycine-generating enzyme required for sulfatase activity